MTGLEGKTAIVTGASRGIGRAIAMELAVHKVNVAFTYLSGESQAASLTKDLSALGVQAYCAKVDVRSAPQAEQFVKEVKSKFPGIDFLVNNAGIVKDKSLMMMTEEEWKDVLETNLYGVFHMTRLLIVSFLKQKSGVVVNVSSTAGLIGNSGQTNYAASKAGIIGFTKSLARETAAYGVRVNAVAPGFIETEMLKGIPETKMQEALKSVPMKKLGKSQDVAKLVAFLLSDASSYITGHVFPVDGGLAI